VTAKTELKKRELERLLEENKIDVNQYLEASAQLQEFPSTDEVKSVSHEQARGYGMLKTDILLIASPILILVGWLIANLNPVSAYTSDHLEFVPGMTGYPYSPIGLGIIMSSIVLLSVGITRRWVKSVSRGEFIILEVTGWFVLMFALYVLAIGIRVVWVQEAPYSWHSFISIDPAACSFVLLLWFIGVLTIAYGLVPLRKWFGKSVS
jgi:hypothetical protein